MAEGSEGKGGRISRLRRKDVAGEEAEPQAAKSERLGQTPDGDAHQTAPASGRVSRRRKADTSDDTQECDELRAPKSAPLETEPAHTSELDPSPDEAPAVPEARKSKKPLLTQRRLLIGIAGLCVLLCGVVANGLYNGAKQSDEGRFLEEVEALGLRDGLFYRDLNAFPLLGSWSMSGPETTLGGVPTRAEEITVHRAVRNRSGALTGFSLEANRLTADLTPLFRQSASDLSGSSLRLTNNAAGIALISLGYGRITGDATLKWDYLEADRKGFLELQWTVDTLGTIDVEVVLTDLTPAAVRYLEQRIGLILTTSDRGLPEPGQALSASRLEVARLTLTDGGFKTRLTAFEAYPDASSLGTGHTGSIQTPRAALLDWAGQRDPLIAATFVQWLGDERVEKLALNLNTQPGLRLFGGSHINATEGLLEGLDRLSTDGLIEARAD